MSEPAAPAVAEKTVGSPEAMARYQRLMEQMKAAGIQVDDLLKALNDTGDFMVLTKFKPIIEYKPDDGGKVAIAMFIDTETTGKDVEVDVVIEIGYLLAEYNPDTGELYRVIDTYNGLQDPGFPIPEESRRVHGITDEDVAGKTFDIAKIKADTEKADIVIAHNASFDRRMLERVHQIFAEKHWACAMNDGPWEEAGITTRKQDYIAFRVCNQFYDAHRAQTDANVLLHIQTHTGPDGRPFLASVLDKARKATFRVWADGSSFDAKDILKKRGYRWSPAEAEPGMRPKVWYMPSVEDLDAELEWLSNEIYHRAAKVTVDKITAFERYSTRVNKRDQCSTPDPAPPQQMQLKPR